MKSFFAIVCYVIFVVVFAVIVDDLFGGKK